MRKYLLDFAKRGLMAAVGGPIVLAIVYGILGATGVVESLSPFEVTKGILTVSLMAFIAAGVSVVYSIERLPLVPASLIHGVVLYLDYILIYLLNGWLKSQLIPVIVFTSVFVVGYAVIWLCIYLSSRTNAEKINHKLCGADNAATS